MTPNSLTAFAQQGQPHSPGRPPFVDWTMRLLDCVTDATTTRGDVERMVHQVPAQIVVAVTATVRACIAEMKKGAAAADSVPPEAA